MSDAICNPINLPYRFQDIRPLLTQKRSLHREAADPTIIRFQGRFYLFASMSGGFWHSDDLVNWEFRATPELPVYDYAPDVREIDGRLVFTASASFGKSAFYRTSDPMAGAFEKIDSALRWFDPNLFQDDDGRVFFYWGCSNRTPIRGVELDRSTLEPLGEPVDLIASNVTDHGWEEVGDHHDPQQRSLMSKTIGIATGGGPFIEGAWMTKYQGTYYLQYAAPGAESSTYADGYYTSASPLGPYSYSIDSPFSSKFGGFVNGAGHGSTFQDGYGNWWHASTMRISKHHMFERRVGIFPAGFDEDGVLFCNQQFADYPVLVPDRRIDPWQDTSPGWMLLSYQKPVTALSSAKGHGPELAVNEDIRDWWVAGRRDPGQWLTVDLGAVQTVNAVQVNFAEHKMRRATSPKRTFVTLDRRYIEDQHTAIDYILDASVDGQSWVNLRDTRGLGEDVPHDFVVIDGGVRARYVRLTGYRMPYGAVLALSGLRVFGKGNGHPPAAVSPQANSVSAVAAQLHWSADPDATGFNVRYGRTPEKLYHSWLVYGESELLLTGLNAGVGYFVAVDSFNENGVTAGAPVAVRSAPGLTPSAP